MGSLNDDLDILQGSVVSRTAPAIGQAVTPLNANRTVFVSASMKAQVLVSLNFVRSVIEVSDDGVAWEEVDVGFSSAGALSLLRALDGHTKLGAFVRPGQMYRFGGTGQGTGGSFTVQEVHETPIEISSHRSVAFEYLSGATAVPDNSHMHECGAPCFTPSLFIDQYKRDPSEQYRDFEAGEPPKGYVRAEENGGGSGAPGGDVYGFKNNNADDGITDWTATGFIDATNTQARSPANSWRLTAPPISFPQSLNQGHDVSGFAADIDNGTAAVSVTAWVYFADAGETANLSLIFLNGSGGQIARSDGLDLTQASVGALDWFDVTHADAVPVGTREIQFEIVWQDINGTVGQIWFDDVEPMKLVVPAIGGGNENYLWVRGRKASETTDDSFKLNWRGVDYTSADAEVSFPTPTTWSVRGDPGPEIGAPGELLTITQNGQPAQQVAICVDRTAPAASLAFNGMTVGTDGLAPMLRGEYAKLLPTYSDGGVGIESASLVYENAGYWSGEPTNAPQSGVATSYFRSSVNAPAPGNTDITLQVEDKAGNIAEDSLSVFFGALPVQPAVSLAAFTGAERPAHLNESEFAETPYNDKAVGAIINIAPTISACRNSGRDDTSSQLLSAGLLIDDAGHVDIANQSTVVHAANVVAQPAKLGKGFVGRVRDQHYRNSDSAEGGNFAFNSNRADDFGQDQTIGIGSPPFTGKGVEPFTDEFAGDTLTDCRILDGAVEWLANGAVLEVTVQLTSNSGQLYQPRLFDKAGSELLYATYSADVDVKLHDGASFVAPASGDSFGPNASYDLPLLNGASSVQARITVADMAAPSLGAFILNYKA